MAHNATEPGQWLEFLGRVAYEAHLMQPLFPTYCHLMVSAIFPIYIAAHASLTRPSSAAATPKKKGKKKDEADEEVSQKIENLSPSDALVFPLLAGCTLASLYFILKWLQDPAWLNWVLGLYFSQLGLLFAFKFLKDGLTLLRSFAVPTQYSSGGQVWTADNDKAVYISTSGEERKSPLPGILRHLPLPNAIKNTQWSIRRSIYTHATLSVHAHRLLTVAVPTVPLIDVVALLISASLTAYHAFIAKPWPLTNFLGFSFCYSSLQFITPTTAWTGTLILSALFFYDIYFIFYTPMMVTVATKLDVPIKLLFPRPDGCIEPVGALTNSAEMEAFRQCIAKKRTMAMLGLGDIVVPGIMIALALRFDLYLFYSRKQVTKRLRGRDSASGREVQKASYSPATGSWGERLWTSSRLRSEKLKAKSFPKTYFHATCFGYVAGLMVTVVIMQVFQHAQPALLYLVPGILTSFWGTALLRGELWELWNYTEADEEELKKLEKEKKAKEVEEKTAKGDKATEANGHAESPSKKAQREKPKKESKPDPEDRCRSLFYITVTLPKADLKLASPNHENALKDEVEDDLGRSADSEASSEVDDSPANDSVLSTPSYNLRNRSSRKSHSDRRYVAVRNPDEEHVEKRRRKA